MFFSASNLRDTVAYQGNHQKLETESFTVNTGIKQGCLMAPFLFLLAIDWIMKETTRERQNGIQWNLGEQLNDLEFVDGISLVSSNNQQMQS